MKHLRFMIAILLMLLVVVLLVQNEEAMSTQVAFRVNLVAFNYHTSSIPLYFLVAIAFFFGVLIMGLYGMVERFRLKRQIKVIQNASEEKDRELNSLRTLPITSEEVTPEETESP